MQIKIIGTADRSKLAEEKGRERGVLKEQRKVRRAAQDSIVYAAGCHTMFGRCYNNARVHNIHQQEESRLQCSKKKDMQDMQGCLELMWVKAVSGCIGDVGLLQR